MGLPDPAGRKATRLPLVTPGPGQHSMIVEASGPTRPRRRSRNIGDSTDYFLDVRWGFRFSKRMKTDARPPPKDPFVIDLKRAAWLYPSVAIAAFLAAAAIVEGPVSTRLANRDAAFFEKSIQPSSVLTEDHVRTIVKDELKEELTPVIRQLEEIQRRLPPSTSQVPVRKAPGPH